MVRVEGGYVSHLGGKRSNVETLSCVAESGVQQIHHIHSSLVVGAAQSTEEEDEGVSPESRAGLDSPPGLHHRQLHGIALIVLQETFINVDIYLNLLDNF